VPASKVDAIYMICVLDNVCKQHGRRHGSYDVDDVCMTAPEIERIDSVIRVLVLHVASSHPWSHTLCSGFRFLPSECSVVVSDLLPAITMDDPCV
jgi:hypothetical protein